MNQATKKMLTENQPALREASASECEAITGGYDDTLYCGTPWSKIPPYPQLSSAIVIANPGIALVR